MRGWFRPLIAMALFFSVFTASADQLMVGSKRFTESYILGEIITQTARNAGADVAHRQGMGGTAILFEAIKTGSIDIYPDYTGTIARQLLKTDASDLETLNRGLRPLGLGVAAKFGFNNTYALALREDEAERLGVSSVSHLSNQPELRFGLGHEFLERNDGWSGLKATYDLPHSPAGLDHGLAYEAIASGQIDVMDIYSTDAKIARYGLRVLSDDKKYFPDYDAVLVYRLDVPERFPEAWAALVKLEGAIDAKRMIAMNARAELDGASFSAIAADFAKNSQTDVPQSTQSRRGSFLDKLAGADFLRLTGQHLLLVFVSLGVAIVVGIPLGVWAARSNAVAQPILSAVGIIQTIPALALLVFLIPLLGRIGTVPALVALFLYSLLPIVRNTYSGITDIAGSLRESASALGLSAAARLRLIELPLASRAILAGIKTSAVINVGTATIAAFIGAGGYGERIVTGLALNDHALLLAGAIPAAVLALLVQWTFDLADRWIVAEGLR
ncbi:MAG: ABC transporter permease subunit [Betaproteobacteria bacterium]|nr:MAG: ABC transporter permease subunit [Betaproteobacteria bacterium]